MMSMAVADHLRRRNHLSPTHSKSSRVPCHTLTGTQPMWLAMKGTAEISRPCPYCCIAGFFGPARKCTKKVREKVH
jgi:hypothetical protein